MILLPLLSIVISFILFISTYASPRLERIINPTLTQDDHPATLTNTISTSPPTSSSFLPLNLRSINDCELTNLLLISDIDGNLHGVSRKTGNLLWSLPIDKPLVNIQTNNTQDNNTSNILWFVEPHLDGFLYYFTPKYGLNKLPTSIKDLVMNSPFSLINDDKIYTGERKTSLYSINIHTGEIQNSFGHDKCPIISDNTDLNSDEHTIMIGKTTYELTIHSKTNQNVVWNVTYSQWVPNNIDQDLIMQNQQSLDKLYFSPFHDRSLLAINKDIGTPVWFSKLPSLAVNIFDIFNNNNNYILLPHPTKVLNDLQIENSNTNLDSNLVFINKTSNLKQWIAMSYKNYPTLIKSAPISNYQMNLNRFYNNNFDPKSINYMEDINLNDDQQKTEELISGLHKVFEVSSDSSYQPISRFDKQEEIRRIGDGNDESTAKVPSIIDGIKFPTKDNVGTDIIVLPKPNEKQLENYDYDMYARKAARPTRTPLIKRVFEDAVILLVLIILVIAFGKSNKYIKRLFQDSTVEEISDFEQISIIEKPQKQVTIVEPISEETRSDTAANNDNNIDEEGGELELTSHKKRKRGGRGQKKRGGKKINKNNSNHEPDNDEEDDKEEEITLVDSQSDAKSLIKSIPQVSKKLQMDQNLIISETILGFGSHGTVVFKGTFENRPVAVKRMLLDFYDIANHEVKLLQESDDHPNVVRYFCSQTSESEKFLYIALELCLCTLENIIETPNKFPGIKITQRNNILYQLACGLNYLHSLKIVHRDIKPQNILVSLTKDISIVDDNNARLLISDFGLCKKLETDQSSFRVTTQHAASGTSGWRAPELLINHEHNSYEVSPDSISSTTTNIQDEISGGGGKRLTKSIDIFSLGCVFFYILSDGSHPFGDRYLREGNIIKGEYDLSILHEKCPHDQYESIDLISKLIDFNPSNRLNTTQIMRHPLFWPTSKRLEFLLKVSDRFEIERREPPSALLQLLESKSEKITNLDWHGKFESEFLDNLKSYRKYHTFKLMDLLRALRNKYHHFNEIPPKLQSKMLPLPNGFYRYFNNKFPNLLMEIYYLVEENLKDEHVFREYYV